MSIKFVRVSAQSGASDVWVRAKSTCKADGPVALSTGEDRTLAEARGEIDKVGGIIEFCVWNTGRWGDLLWTGDVILIASDHLIDALRSLGVQEFSTFPISIRDERGQVVDGYQGFVPSESDREADIHSFHSDTPHFAFVMSEKVVASLRDLGISGFDVEELPGWY